MIYDKNDNRNRRYVRIQNFSTDVIHAYLQSAYGPNKDIFINSPKEFNLKPDELIKLLKPLNGLAESGDHWGRKLRYHLEENLGIETCVSVAALFFKKLGKNTYWIIINIR